MMVSPTPFLTDFRPRLRDDMAWEGRKTRGGGELWRGASGVKMTVRARLYDNL